MLIIDMPKKYLTDASGFVSCAMCKKYLPLLYRNCHEDFKGCLIKGELPDEHGDLKDRDELLKECYPDDEFDAHVIYADDIQNAKAVIAAERKDDGTTAD